MIIPLSNKVLRTSYCTRLFHHLGVFLLVSRPAKPHMSRTFICYYYRIIVSLSIGTSDFFSKSDASDYCVGSFRCKSNYLKTINGIPMEFPKYHWLLL